MNSSNINFGYGILEATSYKWEVSEKPIRHYILTVVPNAPPATPADTEGESSRMPHLHFKAHGYSIDKHTARGVGSMTDHARTVLGTKVPRVSLIESPFDMKVQHQSWLLVQLDPELNWQFAKGEVPCTLKVQDLRGRNILLRHVYDDGRDGEGVVLEDGCRTLFFAVVQRDKPDLSNAAEPWRCFVNFNVEFIQTDEDPVTHQLKTTRLKLIIDPDVPNEGPNSIP